MKQKIKLFATIALCIMAFACSKNDDAPQPERQTYEYAELEVTYGVTNSFIDEHAPEVTNRTLLDVFNVVFEITDFSGNTTIDTCKGSIETVKIRTIDDVLPATCSFRYVITKKDNVEYGKYGANMQLFSICEAFSTNDKPMSTLVISNELMHWDVVTISEATIDEFEQKMLMVFGKTYTVTVSGSSDEVTIVTE